MKTAYCLDASALLAYFEGAAGAVRVRELLEEAKGGRARIIFSALQGGEVFYVLWGRQGRERAEQVMAVLEALPVEEVPVDRELIRLAASMKAVLGLPYVDSFAAAVAFRESAQVVTRDADFRRLEQARGAWGRVPVVWLSGGGGAALGG